MPAVHAGMTERCYDRQLICRLFAFFTFCSFAQDSVPVAAFAVLGLRG